jgi:C4-dicarboxylate-binding protein DctP
MIMGQRAMWIIRSKIIGAALCLLISDATRADEILLRVSLQQSITDPVGQNILDFKQEVETRTKGAVKVRVNEKAKSVPGRSLLQAVGNGQAEMRVGSLGEIAKDVPAAGLFAQPFLFNFDSIVQAATRPGSEIRNIIDGETLKLGARVLWWQPYGSTVIFSKGSSIANPRGLSNHKIGVFDEVSAEFINLCGGAPKLISEVEQVEAMKTKAVDSTMASVSAIRDYDVWREADTITNIRYSESLFVVLIDEKIWRSLSREHQKIIADAAVAAEMNIWERFAQTEAEAYDLALQKGMKIEALTADDTLAWRDCSSSILETFVSRTNEIGARLLAAYGKLRSDPCCSQALQSPTGD